MQRIEQMVRGDTNHGGGKILSSLRGFLPEAISLQIGELAFDYVSRITTCKIASLGKNPISQ